MYIHQENNLTIIWGGKLQSIAPQQFYAVNDQATLLATEPFSLVQAYGAQQILTVRQTHSARGYAYKNLAQVTVAKPYEHEGDYLITSVTGTALVVASADCLPLVMYDPVNGVVTNIHAGWRGAVAGIAACALQQMCDEFNTARIDVQIFFGPVARACCYEVDATFVQALSEEARTAVYERAGKYYFDLVVYHQHIFKMLGVAESSLHVDKAVCTICSDEFCSARRDKGNARRNVTMVCLR